MELRFKIFRFDPEVDKGPYYKYYQVSADPEERILDCLNKIRWEQDGSLAYRMSCGHGICGSDAMKINGVCGLACQQIVKDYACPMIVLEPLPVFRVLKDLIVDLDEFLGVVQSMRPFLIPAREPPEAERIQSKQDRQKIEDVTRCILCACCTAACPVMRYNPKYVGPGALMWAFRAVFDSRDSKHAERLRQLNEPNGVWPCVNHFECTRVCPQRIPVTKCISQLKREIRKTLPDSLG